MIGFMPDILNETRRIAGLIVALACFLPCAFAAEPAVSHAELTVLVPFPAGGSADLLSRLFVAQLNDRGVSAIVVNLDGGSGVLAFRRLLAGGPRPEVLVGPATPMLTGLLSPAEMGLINERRQLVCQLYDNKMVLVRRRDAPGAPTAQLLRSPSTRISSGGVRSIPFLTLAAAVGQDARFTHIPYRGEYPALVALAQREVEASVVTYASFLLVRTSLDLQAVTLLSRAPWDGVAGVPLLGDAGFPVKFASSPAVVVVQQKARSELVTILRTECERFVSEEPSRSRLIGLGIDPVFRGGVEAMAAIQAASGWLTPVGGNSQ